MNAGGAEPPVVASFAETAGSDLACSADVCAAFRTFPRR